MRKEQRRKGWNEIKTNDSWAIFKIMGEFVNGFEKMSQIGPCISIFGSARTKPEHKYYKLAERVARKIVESGYGIIITGNVMTQRQVMSFLTLIELIWRIHTIL